MKILLAILGIYAFLYLRSVWSMRRLYCRVPRIEACAEEDITPAQRAALDAPRAFLEGEGFRHAGWCHVEDLLHFPDQPVKPQLRSLYLGADDTILCTVLLPPLPQPGVGYLLSFESRLADGREVLTVNRAALMPMPEHVDIRDDYLGSDAEHLALHRQRIADRSCIPYADADDVLRLEQEGAEKLVAHWQRIWLRQDAHGWRLTWKGAWECLRILQRHNARLRKLPLPVTSTVEPEISRQAELDMLEMQLRPAGEPAGLRNKVGMFLLTGLAFVVLGHLVLDYSWGMLAALVLVLLVHELGHFAAMKAFGYSQLGIFFLPLLGAAAQGRKDSAPPWQQLVILLAGPVPGMVLALAYLAVTMTFGLVVPVELSQFVLYVVVFALAINFINLLPIMPLDGGRVTELLFFSRFPRASFWFFVAGVVALAVIALWLQDPITGVIAVVLALSISFQRRLMQVSRELQAHYGQCVDQRQALELLADAFSRGVARNWLPASRISVAKSLLPRLQGGVPGWPTLVAGAAVYLGLLFAPAIALVAVDPQALTSPVAAVKRLASGSAFGDGEAEMERRLARAKTPDQKIRARISLYYHFSGRSDDQKASEHLQEAYRLAIAQPHLSEDAVTALSMQASLLDARDPGAADSLIATVEARLTREADRKVLARWLMHKDHLLQNRDAPLAERIANRERELAVLDSLGEDFSAAYTRRALAGLHLANRQPEAALTVLQANWNRAQKLDPGKPDSAYLREATRSDLAWGYIRNARQEAALELYREFRPAAQPFERYMEEDYLYALLPEQTQAYVWLTVSQPEPAAQAFAKLREAWRKIEAGNPDDSYVITLELDLLLSQRRAGQTQAAAVTQQRIRTLLEKSADARDSVLYDADYRARDPENLAAPRATEHLALLAEMGYQVPKRSESCPANEEGTEKQKTAEDMKTVSM